MTSRSNRTLSPEIPRASEADKVKRVGRFAVSPPLSLETAIPRRSARLSRGGTESTRVAKLIMQNYETLGDMIEALIDRNSKLEDENDRLNKELRTIQGRLVDSSPASYYSESADECRHKGATKGDRVTNS